MKKVFKATVYFTVIFLAVMLLSSGDTKRYSGGGRNMVEELYNQAEKQNASLETLADDIERFYKKKQDAVEKFNSFINYNNHYYSDAKSAAGHISDSAARQKANRIISTSENTYRSKLTDWENTLASINAKERELNDLQELLKIMTTVPMIEKLWQNTLPESSQIKQANADLAKVIEKIKELTR